MVVVHVWLLVWYCICILQSINVCTTHNLWDVKRLYSFLYKHNLTSTWCTTFNTFHLCLITELLMNVIRENYRNTFNKYPQHYELLITKGAGTDYIHTYIHFIDPWHPHKGHLDMKHCQLSGMITRISCHDTQNNIQQDNTQTCLHKNRRTKK